MSVELEGTELEGTVLDGTVVLEKLAAVGLLEAFSDAIDSDNTERARQLMRDADVDESTISQVLAEMGAE